RLLRQPLISDPELHLLRHSSRHLARPIGRIPSHRASPGVSRLGNLRSLARHSPHLYLPTSDFDMNNFSRLDQCFQFADLVGSNRFQNHVMDAIQGQGTASASASVVNTGSRSGSGSGMDLFRDYVLECVAYRIVTRGWVEFMQDGGGGGVGGDGVGDGGDVGGGVSGGVDVDDDDGVGGSGVHTDTNTAVKVSLLSALSAKVDQVNGEKEKERGLGLISPSERRDCKWHQHHTEGERRMC
ncbi:hypothetical protein A1O3_04380, partial [Capronia epimyces CBS 606.96]